jgi:hypothetical protein
MPADAWLAIVKFNFNDTVPYPVAYENPFEYEAGWSERYYFPFSTPAAQVVGQLRQILAYRAACLAGNYYIFSAMFGQLSVYRDSYAIPGYPTQPIIDQSDLANGYPGYTNNVESAVMLRFETPTGRRWTKKYRGIKDNVESDYVPVYWSGQGFGNTPFDAFSLAGTTNAGFAFAPVSPVAIPFTYTNCTLSATVAGGAVTALTVAGGGGGLGYLNGGSQTLIPVQFIPPDGKGSGATATATVVDGAVTAVTLGAGGTGYTTGTALTNLAFVPVTAETYGVPQYMPVQLYHYGLWMLLAQYTINFNPIRVVNPLFPSGFMTQVNTNAPYTSAPYSASRVTFQRMASRKTGRINLVKPARRKRPI